MSKVFVAVVAIATLITASLIWFTANHPATPKQQTVVASPAAPTGSVPASGTFDTSNWLTYRNPKYNYSFKYPPEYSLDMSYDDFQDITSHPTSSSTVSVAGGGWLQVTIRGNLNWKPFSSQADFIKRARIDLQNNCSYSGPVELMLTDVVSESTSTNQNGLLYYDAYFKWLSSGSAGAGGSPGTKALGIVGPFYAFDIERETSGLAHMLEVAPAQCIAATSSTGESPTMHAFIEGISF